MTWPADGPEHPRPGSSDGPDGSGRRSISWSFVDFGAQSRRLRQIGFAQAAVPTYGVPTHGFASESPPCDIVLLESPAVRGVTEGAPVQPWELVPDLGIDAIRGLSPRPA
jgi:hypothetical protein